MLIEEDDYLAHYGTPRKSGRYPFGSGDDPYQNSSSFLAQVGELREKGLSQTEIANAMGINTTKLRAYNTIATNEVKQADINMAQRLKDKGMSNVEIGKRMGRNESSVRGLLAPGAKDKADILLATSNMLQAEVDGKGYIDIGKGVDAQLGISPEKLSSAVAVLEAKGYTVHSVQVPQLGTKEQTTVKVLAPPGTEWKDVAQNKDQIRQIQEFSDDGGRSFTDFQPPLSIDQSRVAVRYADEGGTEADGVIFVRPGVGDVALGGSSYAQVRIAVDGSHYLKGMAIYKDDLPDGVDLMFNTNKSDTGNKLDAMKKLQRDTDGNVDQENPFGASIKRQIMDLSDPDNPKVTSAANIVNEEGDWDQWSRNLSTQMLSKQSRDLAQSQLDITYATRKNQFDEIDALTNPKVRQKLMESFADDADAAAVHLRAAALPRQATQVILPVEGLSDREVYAPNFRDGERVALIRYPHGGTFEIPELTVNNRHPEAKGLLGQAKDAIGINAKVAERLSGADFDGDTVVVIPNSHGRVKSTPALEGLSHFDPQAAYPAYDGMPRMSARTKGIEMGKVSNLITDMTIGGADTTEIARAVRHSMVVIDAEKHNLDYRQSAIDNGIPALMKRYQGRTQGGASTLISLATSETDVPDRKARPASEGGPVDKATGKRMYVETGATTTTRTGKVIPKTSKSARLAETDDAFTLVSEANSPIERLYATHSNRLKSLANDARREAINTKQTPYSPSAKKAYSPEVDSLNAQLNTALKNKPRERQAQIIGNSIVREKRKANPDMSQEDVKKEKARALAIARNRTGADKTLIHITDREWDAIQAGAISTHKLDQILNNADMDRVKQLATPRTKPALTASREARAKAMLRSGRTQREVADALGVSIGLVGDLL